MTLLSVPNIPLLVQEKLDYYIWKNKANNVHKEYNQRIIIESDSMIPHDVITLLFKGKDQTNIFLARKICYLKMRWNDNLYTRFTPISKFTIPSPNPIYKAYLPKKYTFSSGLNSCIGYREFDILQMPLM